MADDAYSLIQEMLGPYNLPDDLMNGAWQQYLNGSTPAEILVWLRQQPSYKAAYPGIDELRAQGSPYGSEPAYAQYIQTAKEQARLYGLPPEMYDQPDDFVAPMKGNVSLSELNQRYQMAASAAYTMPQQVRDALTQMGVDSGGLISFFLDPDRATPILDRKFRAAQVMGAGSIAGIGIDQDQAENLADEGVTFQQAQQGAQQVASMQGLTAALGSAEVTDTRALVDAILGGSANATAQAQRVQKSRAAQFQQGGGAASQTQGVSGLGQQRST